MTVALLVALLVGIGVFIGWDVRRMSAAARRAATSPRHTPFPVVQPTASRRRVSVWLSDGDGGGDGGGE